MIHTLFKLFFRKIRSCSYNVQYEAVKEKNFSKDKKEVGCFWNRTLYRSMIYQRYTIVLSFLSLDNIYKPAVLSLNIAILSLRVRMGSRKKKDNFTVKFHFLSSGSQSLEHSRVCTTVRELCIRLINIEYSVHAKLQPTKHSSYEPICIYADVQKCTWPTLVQLCITCVAAAYWQYYKQLTTNLKARCFA